MNPDICIYSGSASAFNVRRTLLNVGRMLSDRFSLHHVTSSPAAFGAEHRRYFSVHSSTDRGGHIGGVLALRNYLETHSPSVLTHIAWVPINANVISLLGRSESALVSRYSGDTFYEYRLQHGWQRAKRYVINNGLGRLPLYTSDKIIAMGPRGKRRLIDRGYPSSDVVVLPPPVSRERFENPPRVEMSHPSGRKMVLFVGRVSRLKGAETLEATIPQILDERPNLQFVFLGDEQYEFDFPESVRDHVTFEGRVPPEEVPAYVNAADLYVHPSLTEGLSRSVVEALMAGTPVIARDVGDLAYATSNLFTTDRDFVRMVSDFERFPVDDASKFEVERLQRPYRAFFTECVER